MIHFNLGSHDGRTIEELTSLVEATERAAFTTSSAAGDARSLVTKRPSIQNTRCATRSVSPDPQKQFAESVEFDSQLPKRERSIVAVADGNSPDSAIHFTPERCQVSCYNGDSTRQNDFPCGQDLVPGSDYCLEHQEEEE